ncbi:PLD nuclease N-terminal domain-containing protein [Clostridium sp. CS001]|uniref:PLDc N-terminal domain-containing protein n=1 Tax=Clostridium sp. CS001 TaxID=2880648 RepID=UPI001CF1E930|nr:PLD nuclease N-terminal domain-containing protein [Clostridium sp. CS001]MCB2288278.1 PLD nuclease N-terminal domain-containing protein [Clostridium sp. CS001]
MFNEMELLEIIKLFAPIIILEVILVGFCLYRLTKDRVKFLPKWAWALIVICVQLIGGIAFLLIGRERE